MELKTLHLEETIVLPDNYKEIIFDKNVLTTIFDTKETTPEKKAFQEKGFYGTRGADDVLDLYLLIDYEMTNPFHGRVRPNYEDPNDRVLMYQLEFYLKRASFAPFYKYINTWGRKNRKGAISLNYYFAEWLIENMGEYDEQKDGFSIDVDIDSDEVSLTVTNEESYMRLLKEFSAAFRTLATEHSGNSKDKYDNYGFNAIFNFKEKDFKGVDYTDLTDYMLIPAMGKGLEEGLGEFRDSLRIDEDVEGMERSKYEGEYDHDADMTVSVGLDPKRKRLQFYRGDKCEGKPFYEFKMGAIVAVCVSLAKEKETPYGEELARWFKEAAEYLPNRYSRFGISLRVPEAGNPAIDFLSKSLIRNLGDN